MNFKKLLPHLVAIAIFYVTAIVLFTPQFQGKELPKGDLRGYIGGKQETVEFAKEKGDAVLWNNNLFGGMPNYQVVPQGLGNYLSPVSRVFYGFMQRPAGLIFLGMLCAYLMLVLGGVNPWLGIVGALAAGLATNGFVLTKAGQMTKITTVFYIPLTAAGILLTYRKRYIWGMLVFALGMGLTVLSNHYQMLYYYGLTLPFFGIGRFLYDYRRGETIHFFKAAGFLVVGFLIAIGANAASLWTTLEYTPETMRGGQVLEEPVRESNSAPAGSSAGLEWDYAMQWSNGFIDLVATYSPLAAGGGNGTKVTNDSAFGKAMRKEGLRVPAELPAPTYFGKLPFTEGPQYVGAVVWALFLFGMFTAKGYLRVWIGGGMLFLFLLSMGKHFEGMNYFIHNYFPLMKSFRAHNSALSLATVLMMVVGIFGVHRWLSVLEANPEKARKQLLYSGALAAALGVFVALILPATLDYNNPTDAGMFARMYGLTPKDPAALVNALVETRQDLYASSAWRSFLFLGLTFGVLFLLFRKTLSPLVGIALLGVLVVADFAPINQQYLGSEDWRRASRQEANLFPKSPADEAILQDDDLHYRVFNATVSTFQDATTSFYHRSLGGYTAVKMRRIQDVIDAFFLPRNEAGFTYNYPRRQDQAIYNMMNVKYFITRGQDGQPQPQRNPAAFGNAWLPSSIQLVASNTEEFRALATVPDLKATAIVHQEFADEVAGLNPTGEGTVTLTDYTPDEMTYSFTSDGEQLVVFSEAYYGPDLGWTATIDGTETPIIRANYLLRAVRVPAGQHTITMSFAPSSYYTGRMISKICSLLIILGVVGYGVYSILQMRKAEG